MLESLVYLYCFVTEIYINDIDNMICHILQYPFQRQHYQSYIIYVGTTLSLLQLINIFQGRENIQHYVLSHPYFNNISIETYN